MILLTAEQKADMASLVMKATTVNLINSFSMQKPLTDNQKEIIEFASAAAATAISVALQYLEDLNSQGQHS